MNGFFAFFWLFDLIMIFKITFMFASLGLFRDYCRMGWNLLA